MLVYLVNDLVLHHLAASFRVFLCLVFNSLMSLLLHFKLGLCWQRALYPGGICVLKEGSWGLHSSVSLAAFSVFPGVVIQFLPSPLPISVTEQGRCQNLSARGHFLGGQLKTYRNVIYFILCGSSPVSSIGMEVVTGHRAGGILKDIFRSIHSLHLRCS